jgi:hypothetical protein
LARTRPLGLDLLDTLIGEKSDGGNADRVSCIGAGERIGPVPRHTRSFWDRLGIDGGHFASMAQAPPLK